MILGCAFYSQNCFAPMMFGSCGLLARHEHGSPPGRVAGSQPVVLGDGVVSRPAPPVAATVLG